MATLINGDGNAAVYAQQDADWFQAIMGSDKSLILDVGLKMAYEIEDANTIAVKNGVILTKEGRRIQIDVGSIDEFTIPTGEQGVTNYYIIGFHLYTDGSSKQLCETFVEKMNNATDTIPEATFRGGATEVYVSLYRVTQIGFAIDSASLLLEYGSGIGAINASLTDNGHSFKYGFDPISGRDGYYTQEGDFMSFGSGDAKYVVSAHYSVIASYYWEDIMQLQYNNGGVDFEGKTWSAQGNISTFDNDYLTFTSSYTISPVDVSITIAAKHDCTVYSSISVLPIQISAGDTEVISLGDFRNHGNRGGIAIVFYD